MRGVCVLFVFCVHLISVECVYYFVFCVHLVSGCVWGVYFVCILYTSDYS